MDNKLLGLFYAIATMLLAIVLESLEIIWGGWSWLAPSWILVMLLFWVNDKGGLFGIIMAWIFGILVDVWTGAPLGQNALLFIVASFIITFMYKDFRLVEPPAQALLIMSIVFAYKVLSDILSSRMVTLLDLSTLSYLGTGITSSIVWLILVLSFNKKVIQ